MEWAVSTKSVLRRANDPSWQFCAIESAERWLRKRFATDLSLGSAASCLTAELRISQPSSVRVLGARDDRRLGKVVRVGFPDESNAGERVCQLPANLLLHASPCLSASRRSSKQLLHIYSCRGCRDPTLLSLLWCTLLSATSCQISGRDIAKRDIAKSCSVRLTVCIQERSKFDVYQLPSLADVC